MSHLYRAPLYQIIISLSLLWAFPASALVKQPSPSQSVDPFWKNAVVYFMLTDRFANGDKHNDHNFNRQHDGATLRNFMGGDLKGVTQKIKSGYFHDLGVSVLWITPVNEQIHGYWDEDWGRSYPFHGYWPKDWTSVDPNFGTEAEMAEMIATAHQHGMRVLADVIINHTGPKTLSDVAWPNEWIRTQPTCSWTSYAGNVTCALADSLTDIRTESDDPVDLPAFLIEKWRTEGRLEKEQTELDAFFARTQLPRAPKNYIIKWLTDWVREYGIDGFRVDTAKHVEAQVWQTLKVEATTALNQWRTAHPERALDDKPFFMIGEVMHFGLNGFKNTPKGTRLYDYGDKQVDFYDYGFDSLINMGFATHANQPMEQIFSTYSHELTQGPLSGIGVLNYVVSHDDPEPYDPQHTTPYQTALKLMLAPGAVQIYYGDELARNLSYPDAIGDATWRSFMNWQDLAQPETQRLLQHWQKLGQFRQAHLAVGAGIHKKLSDKPYVFQRTLAEQGTHQADKVLVAIAMPKGEKTLHLNGLFPDGSEITDYYSNTRVEVHDNKVILNTPFSVVLLGVQSEND
ncbi:MAG: alpha-amylase family glycosyl hydrolase [Paraglaciecola polaris]|uniref:alpha-amylase family glycosyl hydrolase n=1 Tax=Paraglaciecola polaris TaxID=222814 RepID=UPI003001B602